MKVGTDGVLLGAWVDTTNLNSVLDIGTGCGLLALMLAQRSEARVDAVEMNESAAEQANENIARSPWATRIDIHHTTVQEFGLRTSRRYDLLIANPPYFSDSFKAEGVARNQARHSDTLSPTDLLAAAAALLLPSGRFALIYPTGQAESLLEQALAEGWFCRRKLLVHPRSDKPVHRILLELTREPTTCVEATLVIETEKRHEYTAEYAALTKDFYLRF